MKTIKTSRYKKTLSMTIAAVLLACAMPVTLASSGEANASNLDFSVKIAPVLNVNIPVNLVELEFTPTTSAATFDSENISIGVTTNYKSGYQLNVTSTSTSLTRSGAVTRGDVTTTPTIPTLTSGSTYTQDTFETNKWGIKVATSNASTSFTADTYYPFALSNTLSYSTAPVADANTTVTLAAKTNIEKEAGTYNVTLNFEAVPRLVSVSDIDDLYYMQDLRYLTASQMTTLKNSMTLNEQYQLIDQRDNKTYFISKLADGNIWMTQNLDHVIKTDGSVTYTHNNTDIGYGDGSNRDAWQPASSLTTPATISSSGYVEGNTDNVVTGWTNSQTAPYQGEGGDYYIVTKSTGGTDINSSLSSCISTSGLTAVECGHYHLGNFYNWTAAVAENGTSSMTTDKTVMPDSICPAGWRLPKGLTDDNGTTVQSEYNALLIAAGVMNTSDLSGGQWQSYLTDGWKKLSTAPLFFVRGGYLNGAAYNNTATDAHYWSSTVRSSTNAYNLNANSGGVYPAGYGSRGVGFSVRCLAR